MSQHAPWVHPFLEALRKLGIVAAAARAANISSATAYHLRNADDDFRQAWDDAMEDSIDTMEEEARRRAVDGVEEPVFGKDGEIVGYKQRYSDTLLTFLLKGRRRNVFGDKQEITGAGGGPLAVVDDTRKAARIAALLEMAKTRKELG